MPDNKNIWDPTTASDDECFYRARLGSVTLPTDALATLGTPWEGHGWVGDDGFKNNINRDITKHKAFSGRVVKVTQDSYEETIKVTFYESRPIVFATVFGDSNITIATGSGHRKVTIRHDDDPLPKSHFVIRTVDGVKTRMLVIPEGQVTNIDEINIKTNELWVYSVTIDCFKPATGLYPTNPAGVNEYIDEPDVVSGS